MRIDIVLDLICPWCFIGKRRLEKALALRPAIAPEIAWRPFQLNPEMPAEGMARQDYIAAKFGTPHHASRLHQTMTEAGAALGIPFAFDRIRRTPNTRDAHRLVRHAERQGRAPDLVERVFGAYFVEGRDIGSRATLAEIADEAGLEASQTRRLLAGDAGLAEVTAEDRDARRIGINAVPCFIFEHQYAVSGAQEPEFFLPIFDLVQHGGTAAAT